MEDFYSEANKKYIKGFTNTTLRFLSFSACSFHSLGLPEMFALPLHQILILLPILACHQRPLSSASVKMTLPLLKSGCAPLTTILHFTGAGEAGQWWPALLGPRNCNECRWWPRLSKSWWAHLQRQGAKEAHSSTAFPRGRLPILDPSTLGPKWW